MDVMDVMDVVGINDTGTQDSGGRIIRAYHPVAER